MLSCAEVHEMQKPRLLINEITIYFPARRVNRVYIVRIRLGTLRRENG